MIEKKRLSVDIPQVFHDWIVEASSKRNITITKWILRAIVEKLIKDRDIKETNK